MKFIECIVVVMLLTSISYVRGADFTSDLSDINMEYYKKIGDERISAIGSLNEPLELIIDIRGFIPLTLQSMEKKGNFRDNDKYFRFPIRRGLAVIYYGVKLYARETEFEEKIQKLQNVKIIKESDASKEYVEWIRLAYGMCKDGKKLFSTLGGNIGYNTTEPILLLFTKNNCIIVLSFEYEDFNAKQGQILAAFEFSRTFKEYKKYYDLRNTFFFSKGIRQSFAVTVPIITDLVKLYTGN